MRPSVQKSDARGGLEVHELGPGVPAVRVWGHLSADVGRAFPEFARGLNAKDCEVRLDVRALEGFDSAVRDLWLRMALEFRSDIARVRIVSSKLLITLAAKAAGLVLRRMGIGFEVVDHDPQTGTAGPRAVDTP